MLRIAVCDDDKVFADELILLLENVCKLKSIEFDIDYFSSGDDVLEKCLSYHLIFLDIIMPGVDGIKSAEKINLMRETTDTPFIVFVSGNDNLVFSALKQFPYGFVRKSCLDSDIEDCVERVNRLVKKGSCSKRYSVKVGREVMLLDVEQILYVQKENNYCVFYTNNGAYKERSKIDYKYNDLKKFGFIRTGVGSLVKTSHVVEFHTDEVILDSGVIIPISKKYRKSVKEEYLSYLAKEV